MRGTIDLHTHTTASDGSLTPRALLLAAWHAGVGTIGITDHDNVGAVDEAQETGEQLDIEVIPGVELSAAVDGADIHILGYFIDHHNEGLVGELAFLREQRLKRAERIVGKLNDLRIPLRMESVLERAGDGAVGRPHIATALVDEGLTESYQEAFLKYLGNGKPAYEQKYQVSPRQAFAMIRNAGGLSFIAHPGSLLDEQTILALIRDGVDGIEVIHPSHSPEMIATFRALVTEHKLLSCGGSDFHGGKRNDLDALGRFGISNSELELMRTRRQQ